jgi:hypothetical protein
VEFSGLLSLFLGQLFHVVLVVEHELVELRHNGGMSRCNLAVGHLEELGVSVELEPADVRILVTLLLHQFGVVLDESCASCEVAGRYVAFLVAALAGEAIEADTVAVVANTLIVAAVAAPTSKVDLEVHHVCSERDVVLAEQQQLDSVEYSRCHTVDLDLLATGGLSLTVHTSACS